MIYNIKISVDGLTKCDRCGVYTDKSTYILGKFLCDKCYYGKSEIKTININLKLEGLNEQNKNNSGA